MEDNNQVDPVVNATQLRSSPSASSILAEGWRIKENIKNMTYLRYALIFLISIVLVVVLLLLEYGLGIERESAASKNLSTVINLVSSIITIMLLVPLSVICIRNAIRLSLDMGAVKAQAASARKQLLQAVAVLAIGPGIFLMAVALLGLLLPTVLYVLAFILALVVILYLNLMINVLTLPYIVLRQVNMSDALSSSYNVFKRHFLLFNLVYGALGVVQILLVFAAVLIVFAGIYFKSLLVLILGISFIFAPSLWILPWMHAANGIIFREVYGLKVNEKAALITKHSNSTYYLCAALVIAVGLVVTPVYKLADWYIGMLMHSSKHSIGSMKSSRLQQSENTQADAGPDKSEYFDKVSEEYKRAVESCYKLNQSFDGCNEGVNGIPAGLNNQGLIKSLNVKDGVITCLFKTDGEGGKAHYYEASPLINNGFVGWSTKGGLE